MKCQNCGNHEASFHYRSNINGQITEQHLCQECARSMENSAFARINSYNESAQRALGSFFSPSPFYTGGSLWDSMTRSFFGDFWDDPVTMMNPYVYQQQAVEAPPANTGKEQKNIPTDAGEAFKKKREINRLRSELNMAVKDENFEKAAELRDKIYMLEKEE